MYKHPLGFEYWYADKQGNLVCYTCEPELYVYLCDTKHYLPSLLSTNISHEIPKKKLVLKLKQNQELLPPNVQFFVPSECRQQGESIMKMMFNRSHIAKNSTCNQHYIYNPEAWSSLPQPKVKMPYGHETQTYITNNNMNNLQMLDEIKRTSNECERLKLEMEKQDAEAKEKIEQQNKQFQQILVVATQLIQQQANMLEQFTKVVNETLAVVQTA
ncbi:unnamed protein product, partial [Rotaria sp. Silwood2]